jgi:geranylgeranyl diphosphate synthase, type II
MTTYDTLFESRIAAVNTMLEHVLSSQNNPVATVYPDLLEALRYGTLNGGKRIRAVLLIEASVALGLTEEAVLPVACALEMLHAQSLIHDDLPCMDDDDLRRGKPSLHRAFSESTAVLVGDCLIAMAFGLLAKALPVVSSCSPGQILSVISDFSSVASLEGLINGQYADIDAEGKPVNRETLEYVHRYKTGALFRFAMESAAKLSSATEEQVQHFSVLGEKLGLGFQIVDDLLDIESSETVLGKTVGKDVAQQKATYPALYGEAASREKLDLLYTQVCEGLATGDGKLLCGFNTQLLLQLASFMLYRSY